MCGRGVLPMDGSAYRRLDRVSAVVVDGATLCTGPPVVVEVGLEPAAEAAGWDVVSLWTGTSRLLGSEVEGETPGRLRLGPAGAVPDRPGARVHAVRDADGEQIGEAVVTDELDPHAEALLRAVGEAGHRLVLTAHAGVTDVASLADEVAPPEETLLETVRRVQARGHGGPPRGRAASTCRGATARGPAPRTPGLRCSPRTSRSPRPFPGGRPRGARTSSPGRASPTRAGSSPRPSPRAP
jgi:cation-transporting ATPase I